MTIEDSGSFAGEFDGHDRLWTPHRMAYIKGESKPPTQEESECPFCLVPQKSDEDGLVVYRGQTCYVVLNLFPYNPGHLLVCPYRHVPAFTDLTATERHESSDLIATAMQILTRVKAPAGFNLGMNVGAAAGAGVAAHAHQHIVPRWSGDSNFLPIVGMTKALPELLSQTRADLAQAWSEYGAR